jgi:hypothetical protein
MTSNLAAAATLPPDHPIRRRLLLWAVALGLVGVLGLAGLAAWFPALADSRQAASLQPPPPITTIGRNP